MLGPEGKHLVTPKGNPRTNKPVFYLTGSVFDCVQVIAFEIWLLIKEGVATPEDFFILAPSIKSGNNDSPIKKIENFLVEKNIMVYIPTSDEPLSASSSENSKGKVVFSTLHQCKGLERRFVFATSFSADYFHYFAKGSDMNICPPTLYVAATRATEFLCVVAEDKDKTSHLPFLNRALITQWARDPASPLRAFAITPDRSLKNSMSNYRGAYYYNMLQKIYCVVMTLCVWLSGCHTMLCCPYVMWCTDKVV